METNTFDKLLLQTAFVCMASDGTVADEEKVLLKETCKKEAVFQNIDVEEELKVFASEFNAKGKDYFFDYYKKIEQAELSESEQLTLIRISIAIIKADANIEYSEVKFFKTIRYRLKISDEAIVANLSEDIEDIDLFLGEDIKSYISIETATEQYFKATDFL
ncbi:MAG: TerB family tellurite resistance protein [Prevotellaceae bacterium]|jgi:uncharacterized tellurite resistance protein B-like protein|nr:TerB family tellurite resistance protein [Prevotellaceae bacterium]